MKTIKKMFIALAYFSVVFVLQACMAGLHVIPKSAHRDELKGTYTLILYGCRHPADLETMAVLADESWSYPVEVYALSSMYTVKKGIPASQALQEADTFIRCTSYQVWKTVLRRLSDNAGRTIGYELKPLYRPWEINPPETLLTSYILKDNKVTVYITLVPLLERQNGAGDGSDKDSSGP